ncbi:MAG: M16 family metallopeptidase [Saprospiraceae bacterium]
MKINRWTIILSFLLLTTSIHAQIALQNTAQPIPTDPAVRIGQLENGIKYYIRKNSKPENRAELRLAVNAGAMQEDEDQRGLAHFVEHMAFNGTKKFEKNELVDYLESVGMRFGPDLNAYTSFDETVYMLQARTDSADMLNKGIMILNDWANGLTFDSEEIDKERGVVESERRSSLSPDQRIMYEYLPIVYKDSRYPERLPIGTSEVINNADYETVKRFYRDWYRSDLMSVIAVGDFNVDSVEMLIKNQFSTIEKTANPRKKEKYKIPLHEETRIAIIGDKEAPFTRVQLGYKHLTKKDKTIADFRQSLVENIYNRMLSTRLAELSKQADPPFTFGYSGYGSDMGNLDAYSGYAFVPEGGAVRGLEALLIENKRVLEHGFTATELERQKVELLKRMESAVKEKDKTESRNFASAYVYNYLNNSPIASVDQRFELYQKFLPSITIAEVNQLAKKWITEENRTVIISGPEREDATLPTEEAVRQAFAKAAQTPTPAYEDNVSDAPLLAKKLLAGKIATEESVDGLEAVEINLENGIKVILMPTDYKNDQILFEAFSPGGHSLYEDSEYLAASSATSIINETGLGEFSNIQLQKKLTGKKVGVSPYIGELFEGISGYSSPDDLEIMFKLIYLHFTAPREDSEAFKSYVNKQKSIFENLLSNPQYYYSDRSTRAKYGDNIRRVWPQANEIEQMDEQRVYEIYRDRFADASDFTFSFVGNFEIEKMRNLIATYLGNLPTTDREETWRDLQITLKEGQIIDTFQRGAAQKALVELTWHDDNYEYNRRNNAVFNVMNSVLRIKMRESMREDKGGVYGVSVGGNTSRIPQARYSMQVSFNSEPERVDELIATALADIKDLQENGPSVKDLQKVRETAIQGRTKAMEDNSFWLSNITRQYRGGTPDFTYLDLEKYKLLVNEITAEEVQAAAQSYYGTDNFIKVVMKPESLTNDK